MPRLPAKDNFDEFRKAAEALRDADGSEESMESVEELEQELGEAARHLVDSITTDGLQLHLNRLEAEFGKAARALISAGDVSVSERLKLESDYEQAAIALMQFMHGHQIPGLADLQSDFAKAARELLNAYTQGTGGRKAKADFSRAAKALRECGLGPVIG